MNEMRGNVEGCCGSLSPSEESPPKGEKQQYLVRSEIVLSPHPPEGCSCVLLASQPALSKTAVNELRRLAIFRQHRRGKPRDTLDHTLPTLRYASPPDRTRTP